MIVFLNILEILTLFLISESPLLISSSIVFIIHYITYTIHVKKVEEKCYDQSDSIVESVMIAAEETLKRHDLEADCTKFVTKY